MLAGRGLMSTSKRSCTLFSVSLSSCSDQDRGRREGGVRVERGSGVGQVGAQTLEGWGVGAHALPAQTSSSSGGGMPGLAGHLQRAWVLTKVMARPLVPKRPARPTRCK